MSLREEEKHAGLETLELFSGADVFNEWLFNNITDYCKGTTLEIGSGIGNISKYLLAQNDKVALSDLSEDYCSILKKKFSHNPNLLAIHQIDLASPEFEEKYGVLFQSFETIVALNVVEHIKNDVLAVDNCKKLLKNDGRLIVLVPAYQFLFNDFDTELGHYRRYTRKSLRLLLEHQQFDVIVTKYFNAFGMIGWWFTGSLLKKKIIPKWQLQFFNKFVPLFKLIDKLLLQRTGLSVIAVAKNKL